MRCRCAFALAVTLLLFAAPVGAAILHVRADAPGPAHDGTTWATAFRTIQPALDAAQPGDAVWVATGVYTETVTLRVANLALFGGFRGTESSPAGRTPGSPSVLMGQDPEAPVVTISSEAPVVTISSEAPGAILDGFTVTRTDSSAWGGVLCQAKGVTIAGNTIRGCGRAGGSMGGLVCDPESSALVTNNLIEGNTAQYGAGVFTSSANVTLLRNRLADNVAEPESAPTRPAYPAGRGGGILVVRGTVTLQENIITGNQSWDGGGIALDNAYGLVTRNRVKGNTASSPFGSSGGGVCLTNCEMDFRQNIVANNRAYAPAGQRASGGGAEFVSIIGNIVSNTFVGNVSHGADRKGRYGGMWFSGEGTVANNIFTRNAADAGSAFGCDSYPEPTIYANLFYRNDPEYESGERIPWIGIRHNITGDPKLTNDFHLSPGSAALDAGEVAFLLAEETDFDGEPRVSGRGLDIGADEMPAPPGPPVIYVSITGNDTADGTTWATAKRTVQAGLDAASLDGEVWVARGTYPEHPSFRSRTALYGGFRGVETDRAARDFTANVTTLDGGRRGTVVFLPSLLSDITVDGFTITNGEIGVCSSASKVVISHNIIENNSVSGSGDYVLVGGAGISVGGHSPVVAYNTIQHNRAAAYFSGYPHWGSMAEADGGGLYLSGDQATVTGNLFFDNETIAYGTAAWASGSALAAFRATGLITNNTFVENASSEAVESIFAVGEAVTFWHCDDGLTFANNVIAYNYAGLGSVYGSPIMRNNVVFANVRRTLSTVDIAGTDGNFSADPVFLDRASGNYRPSVGSPLIDAGDDSVVRPGETDLGGNPRILGAHVDIGAYEFIPSASLTLGHAAWALRVAAGFADATPSAVADLDVAGATGSIDLRDAVAIARRALSR